MAKNTSKDDRTEWPMPTSGKDSKPENVHVENRREGNATVGRQLGHLKGTFRF